MKPDPRAYIGYLKVGRGRWEPVVSAWSADLCMELLLAHEPPAHARLVSRQVLPKSLNPNLKNERRPRERASDDR